MSTEKISVSTITWARTPHEEERVLQSLELLSRIRTPIAVADGGSPSSFIEQLKTIPGLIITTQSEQNLFAQIKHSLKKAAQLGSPFVFYTESNKLDFFKEGLNEFLRRSDDLITANPDIGIIIPSRTPQSLNTFPPFQRLEEEMTNKLLRHFLNNSDEFVDYAYGPRIINSSLIPILDAASTDLGWGWLSFMLLMGYKRSKKIHTLSLDLPCPYEERQETELDKIHRMKQFTDHVNAIVQALTLSF